MFRQCFCSDISGGLPHGRYRTQDFGSELRIRWRSCLSSSLLTIAYPGRFGGRAFLGNEMKLQRPALDDPDRMVELERQLEDQMSELLAEAADAGYSMAEVLMAFKVVCDRQHQVLSEDPDPADDPR